MKHVIFSFMTDMPRFFCLPRGLLFNNFGCSCAAGKGEKGGCFILSIFYLISDENVYANNYDNDEGGTYIPESGRLFNLDFSEHLITLPSDVHQSKLRRILQNTT